MELWKTPLLIMGPTASGKSALALALAERFNALILNADSMQIYAELRILTNRPTPEEEARAPHRLFGCVPAASRYSVGAWLREALEVLAHAQQPVIVVGGTGLYFRALTRGLAEAPAAPEALRAALRDRLAAAGPEALHRELARLDAAAAARIQPRDAPRILRALEVVQGQGEALSALQSRPIEPPLTRFAALKLAPDRERLAQRIAARLHEMVEQGALEEAGRIAALRLDPTLPALKAHGLRAFMAAAAGEISVAEAIERATIDTRRYAKRQRTWMAHQMADWPEVGTELLHERIKIATAMWRAVDAEKGRS